jgi:hypothetical protein
MAVNHIALAQKALLVAAAWRKKCASVSTDVTMPLMMGRYTSVNSAIFRCNHSALARLRSLFGTAIPIAVRTRCKMEPHTKNAQTDVL